MYVPARPGTLLAVNASTGDELWRHVLGDGPCQPGQPAISPDGRFVFTGAPAAAAAASDGSPTGTLVALDATSGALVWTWTPPRPVSCLHGTSPVATDGNSVSLFVDGTLAYVPLPSNMSSGATPVVAVAAPPPQRRGWVFDMKVGPYGQVAPVLAPTVVLVGDSSIGGTNQTLYALARTNGTVAWTANLPGPIENTAAVDTSVTPARVFLASDYNVVPSQTGNGTAWAFAAATGAPLWSAFLDGFAVGSVSLTPARDVVLVGADAPGVTGPRSPLRGFFAANGSVAWRRTLYTSVESNVVVDGAGAAAVQDCEGNIVAFDGASGAMAWNVSMAAVTGAPRNFWSWGFPGVAGARALAVSMHSYMGVIADDGTQPCPAAPAPPPPPTPSPTPPPASPPVRPVPAGASGSVLLQGVKDTPMPYSPATRQLFRTANASLATGAPLAQHTLAHPQLPLGASFVMVSTPATDAAFLLWTPPAGMTFGKQYVTPFNPATGAESNATVLYNRTLSRWSITYAAYAAAADVVVGGVPILGASPVQQLEFLAVKPASGVISRLGVSAFRTAEAQGFAASPDGAAVAMYDATARGWRVAGTADNTTKVVATPPAGTTVLAATVTGFSPATFVGAWCNTTTAPSHVQLYTVSGAGVVAVAATLPPAVRCRGVGAVDVSADGRHMFAAVNGSLVVVDTAAGGAQYVVPSPAALGNLGLAESGTWVLGAGWNI